MAIALIIVTIITFGRVFPTGEPSSSGRSVDLRAAVIDQLYSLQPTESFVSEIIESLRTMALKLTFIKVTR